MSREMRKNIRTKNAEDRNPSAEPQAVLLHANGAQTTHIFMIQIVLQ